MVEGFGIASPDGDTRSEDREETLSGTGRTF